jgi:hypothetical protein
MLANITQRPTLTTAILLHIHVNNFWPVIIYSSISQHNLYSMDKKIYSLLTIFIIYFATAVTMSMFPGAQKVLTGLLFGGLGIALFLGAFMIWVLNRKNEG